MENSSDPIPTENIARAILALRGRRVLLDAEIAALYGVTTKVLLQAVRRKSERFPEDFMIQLSAEEWGALRSQFVTLKPGRGQHRKYLPYAFTEQGIAWISPTLKRIQVPARCRAKVEPRYRLDSSAP